jgi:cellulose synthase/poly-beta-1,6-N-acetylglucosamine synthase-like glycosyltransferase
MSTAVAIMAYNEGASVAGAVRSVLGQSGPHVHLDRVTVVASGCTDDTVDRAREAGDGDPRFTILEQARREGKAAAISAFLASVPQAEIVVLVGGDTRLEAGSLEALLAPFDDAAVGMTGGRPVPLNSTERLMGRVAHLLWELHHRVALASPKLGELVAFRPVFGAVPAGTAVDEAEIEALIRAQGLRLAYAPGAVVRMKGPETVRDYLTQRRRIHAGHLQLKRQRGYAVSTMSTTPIWSAVAAARREGRCPTGTLAAAMGLEATARFLGTWDARVVGRDLRAWKPISSTKDLRS